MIFACQIRAARGLLHVSQLELAAETGLGLNTIKNLELSDEAIKKANWATIEKIIKALENKGVRFTFSKEKDEVGVKLRISNSSPDSLV
jgi:transcriptional regulator with XRE-family HTH domain